MLPVAHYRQSVIQAFTKSAFEWGVVARGVTPFVDDAAILATKINTSFNKKREEKKQPRKPERILPAPDIYA